MIVEDPYSLRLSPKQKINFIESGVIIDTCVLIVLFVDMYYQNHQSKNYLLNSCNITKYQRNCLSTIISNLRIKKFVVTPYILSEFLNRLRSELKQDYKDIKREFIKELKDIEEISLKKNDILSHHHFFDFGNDVSLFLATEEQIRNKKYSCILSFDGRFIEKFYRKSKDNVLAFKLDILQHFFA